MSHQLCAARHTLGIVEEVIHQYMQRQALLASIVACPSIMCIIVSIANPPCQGLSRLISNAFHRSGFRWALKATSASCCRIGSNCWMVGRCRASASMQRTAISCRPSSNISARPLCECQFEPAFVGLSKHVMTSTATATFHE